MRILREGHAMECSEMLIESRKAQANFGRKQEDRNGVEQEKAGDRSEDPRCLVRVGLTHNPTLLSILAPG